MDEIMELKEGRKIVQEGKAVGPGFRALNSQIPSACPTLGWLSAGPPVTSLRDTAASISLLPRRRRLAGKAKAEKTGEGKRGVPTPTSRLASNPQDGLSLSSFNTRKEAGSTAKQQAGHTSTFCDGGVIG
jgi:hypothetical protein